MIRLTGARIIAQSLVRHGITAVAGIPGGANLPLFDAIAETPVRIVLARHEQGAGFIAQGMARVTGRAQACLATSGPGVMNLLTAIADAKADSVPLVCITGQVPRALLGTDAFQEVDVYGLTIPIAKHNMLVRRAADLPRLMAEAFAIAEAGRPGPVVIDVPRDVQTEEAAFDDWPTADGPAGPALPGPADLAWAASLLARCERPLLYCGGGAARAGEQVAALAGMLDAPVVTTLMGLGLLPPGHPRHAGMIGMHGAPAANHLLARCDMLVAIGARFDDRATGDAKRFCPGASVIHIDIDPAEHHKNRQAHVPLAGDAGRILTALLPLVPARPRPEWTAIRKRLAREHPFALPGLDDPKSPYGMLAAVAEMLGPQAVVATDVGQNQMRAAQAWPCHLPGKFLTSGGLGTMGFGLPTAIGAALADPGRPVACVTGDGGLLMNVQELATLAELGLPVKILLMDNGVLGLVRQQQALFVGGRYTASTFGCRPDFVALAASFGIAALDLEPCRDVRSVLAAALAAPGPALVRLPVDPDAHVYPMVPPGAANHEMILEKRHAHAE
ncbi:biosynthetic-type acetolactate synthase large subunit [Desulfovibrio sp. TomC]|uniref:biosynthetic-type acetolactate synthase large subunit n=1 Tax=Desulfovibrio sp. TomC TaxID=1562888 RepID=UPI000574E843|nr:biosynthetic-type acetolactate synthase large subunit [Desulfovibrio sp. TomC]KHK02298.1 Acetolactate synthase large subunit [Desulfovibrio sp. TomC]